MNIEIRSLEKQSAELQLMTNLNKAYETYVQSEKVARFEEKNLESAELKMLLAEERYEAGQISSTQFRESQVGFISSQVRISNAEISIKLNELELMRLTGHILSTD